MNCWYDYIEWSYYKLASRILYTKNGRGNMAPPTVIREGKGPEIEEKKLCLPLVPWRTIEEKVRKVPRRLVG